MRVGLGTISGAARAPEAVEVDSPARGLRRGSSRSCLVTTLCDLIVNTDASLADHYAKVFSGSSTPWGSQLRSSTGRGPGRCRTAGTPPRPGLPRSRVGDPARTVGRVLRRHRGALPARVRPTDWCADPLLQGDIAPVREKRPRRAGPHGRQGDWQDPWWVGGKPTAGRWDPLAPRSAPGSVTTSSTL